jgi:hypothetical protein
MKNMRFSNRCDKSGTVFLKASSEKEHTTEQMAAFKREVIFEKREDIVSHDIILANMGIGLVNTESPHQAKFHHQWVAYNR